MNMIIEIEKRFIHLSASAAEALHYHPDNAVNSLYVSLHPDGPHIQSDWNYKDPAGNAVVNLVKKIWSCESPLNTRKIKEALNANGNCVVQMSPAEDGQFVLKLVSDSLSVVKPKKERYTKTIVEHDRIQRKHTRKEKVYDTRKHSGKTTIVHLDNKTVAFVREGVDPEKWKQRFLRGDFSNPKGPVEETE